MILKKLRPFILLLTVTAVALLAYGVVGMPSPQPADAEGFSSARVANDIENISRQHHSVAHPQERAQVREYLVGRLKEIGADTVHVFSYDSLVGPQNKHVEYTFDAHNLLAEFNPLKETEDTTYLMLVAHYDSRYSQPFAKDTVWSYGAADDGYGLGVILETVSQAKKRHQEWCQGIKVLFTDAEEVGMMGMKALKEHNPEVFDNVGFLINVEARGTYGPVLLFETGAGNEKVMDLYDSEAESPHTYSLTSVVYGMMPNFSDFTLVKDSIPGLNFSNVADVNHYHTHLDAFENIDQETIQHYGAQILPVVTKYLTSAEYSDVDALRAEDDIVSFTLPLLGMLDFSMTGYVVLNAVLAFVFLLLLTLEVIRGRVKLPNVFRKSGIILGVALAVLVVGELVAWLCSLIAGADFVLFGIVQGVSFDNLIMLLSMVLLLVMTVYVYMRGRSDAIRQSSSMRANASVNAARHHAYRSLYGALVLVFVMALIFVAVLHENLMFMIPLFCATAAMILYHMTNLRLWLLVGIAFVLLHAFSFLYVLAMALTIGAFGLVMMLAYIDIMVLVPMADLYMMPTKKK